MKPTLVQANILVHVVRHTNDDFPVTELAAFFGNMLREGMPQVIPLKKNTPVELVGARKGPDVTIHVTGLDVVVAEPKPDETEKNGLAAP